VASEQVEDDMPISTLLKSAAAAVALGSAPVGAAVAYDAVPPAAVETAPAPVNHGQYVRSLVHDQGLRGRELAAANHADHPSDRGKAKGKGNGKGKAGR
jgi:hypothetical protein